MKPYNPGASFSDQALSDTAISLINQNGGLTTLYGHNCINDYDTTSRGSWGKIKPKCGNGKIDYVQFLVRNQVYKKDSAGNLEYTYGGHNTGGGHTPHFISYKHRLIIGDTVYQNEAGSYQGVGNTDLSEIGKFPVIHELAHNLLGGNEFHMGGGYHTGTYGYCVQMGAQGGWAMLGGANSSLITCNGFERWRLNWREPDNSGRKQ